MRSFFLLAISIFSFQAMAVCTGLWSRVRVKEAPSYTTAAKSYIVDIELLMDADSSCMFPGDSVRYHVFTGCGTQDSYFARKVATDSLDRNDALCVNYSAYSQGNLKRYFFRDTFNLGSASPCFQMLVYFEATEIFYQNANTANGTVPGTAWVLQSLVGRNKPVEADSVLSVLQACVGEKRHYKPALSDEDGDSLEVRFEKFISYDTASTSLFPTKVVTGFKFPFTDQMPIPSHNLRIEGKTIGFTPFDTGFYALPVIVREWSLRDSTFQMARNVATSYYQIPIFISNDCFKSVYFFGVFNKDTLGLECGQRTVTIPLSNRILTSSISTDGSDFKFSNSKGYPVIFHKVYIPKDTLFVSELKMDLQFFFDGMYQLKIVSGSDRNTVFNECGYQLLESDICHFELSKCPNVVDVGLSERKDEPRLFPNPFERRIKLDFGPVGISQVQMTNPVGEFIPISYSRQGQWVEPQADLPTGFYLLQVEFSDGTRGIFKLLKN